MGTVPVIGAEDDNPEFTVIGSTIEGDNEYFELTMQVKPGNRGFFSAGMVLWYDKSVMRPATWGENAVVLPMGGCTDWRNVASLPVVCPAEISGKTAFAYEETEINPTVSPEVTNTPNPMETPEAEVTAAPTANPTETPEARRRRASDGDNPETTPEVSPSASPEVSPSVSPEATPDASAAPSASPNPDESSGKDGYLYISAESALPVKSLPKEGRVLTIRFKYAGDTAEEMAASKQKIIDKFEHANIAGNTDIIISLATDDVAEASPAGQLVFCGAGDDKETEYYYNESGKIDNIEHHVFLKDAPRFILEQDVQSANTGGGGADPANFAALVFFDWDESTLLGSLVVNGAAEQADIINQTNEFAKGLMAPVDELGNKPEMGDTWADTDAKNCTVYNDEQENGKAKYPLSTHKGYTFGKWIEFDSEDFTVYGDAISPIELGTIETIDSPTDPDYSNISSGLVLKAAYTSNISIDFNTMKDTFSLGYYTLSQSTDPNDGYFARFGTSANYSVKVKVSRRNESNNYIPRTRETALKVTYVTGSTSIVSLLNIQNVDEQIVEVVAPANATSVNLEVIDIGGVSAWASDSVGRMPAFVMESNNYVELGNVNYMNVRAATPGASTPAASYFTAAGLTLPGTTAAIRRTAFQNIVNGQIAKANDLGEDKKYLSKEEMQNCITNGNYQG